MPGKAALHAAQLAAINTVFTPRPNVVAHARSVLDCRAASGEHTPTHQAATTVGATLPVALAGREGRGIG